MLKAKGKSTPQPIPRKELTAEQWKELSNCVAAWYLSVKSKITELFESVERVCCAGKDPQSPLRALIDTDELRDVLGGLERAETKFNFLPSGTGSNIPSPAALLKSFEV